VRSGAGSKVFVWLPPRLRAGFLAMEVSCRSRCHRESLLSSWESVNAIVEQHCLWFIVRCQYCAAPDDWSACSIRSTIRSAAAELSTAFSATQQGLHCSTLHVCRSGMQHQADDLTMPRCCAALTFTLQPSNASCTGSLCVQLESRLRGKDGIDQGCWEHASQHQ
jgi:hypothetical protein